MKLFIIIIIILFSWNILRFFIKRIKLVLSLIKFAKRSRYKFKIISYKFLVPINSFEGYDLLIESQSTLYKIKLLGLLRKYCEIHFWNWQEYSVYKYYSRREFVDAIPMSERNIRHRHLGSFNYSKDSYSSDFKREIDIYLLFPANILMRATQTVGTATVPIVPGDKIGNALFADREYLYWYIENEEKEMF